MNADQDDAPYYLQPTSPRANVARWLVALAIGTAVSLGLLFLASQSFDHSPQVAMPAPAVIPVLRDLPTPVIEARVAAPIEAATQALPTTKAPRQTVFNDHNYQPKPLVNTVSMPPVATAPTGGIEASGVVTGISEKPMACWPFREGSIEYRDCKRMVQLNARNR
jgi:hypothetical protein